MRPAGSCLSYPRWSLSSSSAAVLVHPRPLSVPLARQQDHPSRTQCDGDAPITDTGTVVPACPSSRPSSKQRAGPTNRRTSERYCASGAFTLTEVRESGSMGARSPFRYVRDGRRGGLAQTSVLGAVPTGKGDPRITDTALRSVPGHSVVQLVDDAVHNCGKSYGPTLYGRIISLSSCSTMWQCHTYRPARSNFALTRVISSG